MLNDLLSYALALLLICLLVVAWVVIAAGHFVVGVSVLFTVMLCVAAGLASWLVLTFIGEELL